MTPKGEEKECLFNLAFETEPPPPYLTPLFLFPRFVSALPNRIAIKQQ
jgi:hypothetical protein